MVQKLEITGVHYEVPTDIASYARKKIGGLDGYMSSHSRKSAHIEIKLKQNSKKGQQQFACEVVMHLPHDNLAASVSADNPSGAIDVIEEKLKLQLKKYKEKHHPSRHRALLGRVRRSITRAS